MNPERMLELARAELGTKEYPPGSNNVKYNTEYYGREVSGNNFAWCAVFIWWLFQRAGISGLYYGGQKTAYVPALLTWARQEGLLVAQPEPGDLVCFDFNHNAAADHIGLCESWDGVNVTTIDGNTGTASENNGGEIMRRTRHKKYIVAVIRPRYEEREDDDMGTFRVEDLTDEQVEALAERLIGILKRKPPSDWSAEARKWAEEIGIINGDETGNRQYKKFCTREEVVQILYNHEHG